MRQSASAPRAILVAAQTPDAARAEVERSLAELEQLLVGLGILVDERVVQKRPTRTSVTFVGEGKLRELAGATQGTDSIAVVDDELSPAQLRNLEAALGVEVLDRTAVILRVFEARARTPEARLEVELARLGYELPRIRDDESLGDREGGGGRAARGHTNVELKKQRLRDRMAAIRRELSRLAPSADQKRRARASTFRAALVGYTNAGKSSVMRALTGSDVLVKDTLFATLDTTVRPLSPPSTPPILVADTVGFIDRLPHALIAPFRSTLAEAFDAWLLVHVVDASDPAWRVQIRVTERVLEEIGGERSPSLLVLNKIDRVGAPQREALRVELPDAIQMSALDRVDGVELRKRIVSFFERHLVCARVRIPYDKQGVLNDFRHDLAVLEQAYDEAVEVTVRGTPEALARLRKRLGSDR